MVPKDIGEGFALLCCFHNRRCSNSQQLSVASGAHPSQENRGAVLLARVTASPGASGAFCHSLMLKNLPRS